MNIYELKSILSNALYVSHKAVAYHTKYQHFMQNAYCTATAGVLHKVLYINKLQDTEWVKLYFSGKGIFCIYSQSENRRL